MKSVMFMILVVATAAQASVTSVEKDVKTCESLEAIVDIGNCYDTKKIVARADAEIDREVVRIKSRLVGRTVRGSYDLADAKPLLDKRVSAFRALRAATGNYEAHTDECSGCSVIQVRQDVEATLAFVRELQAD